MDIPTLDETTERVEGYARNLIPWLPDPKICESCQVHCLATVAYDPQMYTYTDAWVCPNEDCSNKYYRDRV